MNIVLDNIIFDLQPAGGISKVWAKQIESFTSFGVDFVAIESGKTNLNLFRKSLVIEDTRVKRDSRVPLAIRRYLSVNVPDCDLFHSSYYRTARHPVRSIVTVHDFMYEKFDSGVRASVHSLQKNRAISLANTVVCVSEHTKSDLLRYYPAAAKKTICVIPNGVDDEFSYIEEKREEVVIRDERWELGSYFLYVGSRGYCKNFPLAVRLFAELRSRFRGSKLLVVNGGAFSLREKRMMLDAGVDPDVDVTRFVNLTNQELKLVYNYAIALLFPSRYEGFGIPALEASKCGCPVIAGNNSSIPEILGAEYPLMFSVDSEVSIRQVINLAKDLSVLEAAKWFGLSGSQEFSWNRTNHTLLDVYAQAIGAGR